MTQSCKAEAAEAFTKKGEGRPAQTARAQARAAKAQAKARHQRLEELEKKVAKQKEACCKCSFLKGMWDPVKPKTRDPKGLGFRTLNPTTLKL